MAKNFLGEIRRTQVLDYGPGSIIDFRAGARGGGPVSVVAASLEHWDEIAKPPFPNNPQVISEPRLERKLAVKGFRLPPVDDRNRDSDPPRSWLVGVRFPIWLQCPSCNEVKPASKWDKEPGDPSRWCAPCSRRGDRIHVIPVRFVVACEKGHLDEFPWKWWLTRAKHKKDCRETGRMKLENHGSIGLSGLHLVCIDCEASIPMEGMFGKDTLENLGCKGRQPWLGKQTEECDATPRVLQRGASNLYFPITVSALSIPPWSDKLQELIGIHWSELINAPRKDRPIMLKLFEPRIKEELGMSLEQVCDEIEKRINHIKKPHTEDLRSDEYKNFTEDRGVVEREFEVQQQRIPDNLIPYLDKLAKVVRLREVRALKSFSRIYEPAPLDEPRQENLGALSQGKPDWLPAVEVRGEGIFLSLNFSRLREWEDQKPIRNKAAAINKNFQKNFPFGGQSAQSARPEITARLLLLHTLSHALLRYVSLECGYETASIRERIYVDATDQEMAGILIYTSSSDSEGTLGGLARQAEPELFEKILPEAIASISWCSSDPLCINGIISTSESYNGAACHSCVLVPETSCERFNRFLDRSTLVGNTQGDIKGYFEELIAGLQKTSA